MSTRDETAALGVGLPNDTGALLAGLVTVTAWGSAFVGIRSAGEVLSPGTLALGRLLVSSAILGAVALARREPLPGRRDLLAIGVYGVLWLIAILAGIFLREGFPPGLFGGCAVAFFGVVLIGHATAESGSRSGLGVALCIVAAFAYALAVVVQKPVLGRVPAFQVTWLGCLIATVACLPFAPVLVSDASGAGASAIAWTVYLGAVPTALGFATWSFAPRRTSAGRMASIMYVAPTVAVALGWAVLGERPPWLAAAGGILCLTGVFVARRPRRSSRRGRAPSSR